MRKNSLIKHELLNLLSIVQYHLIEGKLERAEREHLAHLIRIASLIMSHESLLFGDAPPLFIQAIPLSNILEDLEQRQPKQFHSRDHQQPLGQTITVDRHCFTEGLQLLISLCSSMNSPVNWSWDQSETTLTLHHTLKTSISKNARHSFALLAFQLSQTLLQAHQIEIIETAQRITLRLPQQQEDPGHTPAHESCATSASQPPDQPFGAGD